MEMYCLKCKKKVTATNVVQTKTKKGTPMRKGKCPKCGTVVCRIGNQKLK